MHLYTVTLNVQEDNNGNIGLLPQNCPDFDSIWSTLMLFHDTFEHWFEGQNKYFTGQAANNIGGEIAAMGCLQYLIENFELSGRTERMYNPSKALVDSITYFFNEEGAAHSFGDKLISHVPQQKPVSHSPELEAIAESTYFEIDKPHRPRKGQILDLYRYGYNLAQRMFPYRPENTDFFWDFWQYWDEFFKRNTDPSTLLNSQFTVRITRNRGKLTWKAEIDGHKLNKNTVPYAEEILFADY